MINSLRLLAFRQLFLHNAEFHGFDPLFVNDMIAFRKYFCAKGLGQNAIIHNYQVLLYHLAFQFWMPWFGKSYEAE